MRRTTGSKQHRRHLNAKARFSSQPLQKQGKTVYDLLSLWTCLPHDVTVNLDHTRTGRRHFLHSWAVYAN
ncbi:hypothetical protein R3I94_000427 [Phoxinus phoxinus]